MNSRDNWNQLYPYFHRIYETHIDNLNANPMTRSEFEAYLPYIEDDIPIDELRAFLRRVCEFQPEEYILHNNIKTHLKKEGILTSKDFDKIWNEITKQETIESPEEQEKQELEIPEEYKAKIEAFLHSEDKFLQVEKILDTWITNEKDNKMMTFIDLSGAYFNLWCIIAVIGGSAGGKSYIVRNVIDAVLPKNDWKYMTGASEKHLIYLAKSERHYKGIFFNEIQRSKQTIEQLKDMGDEGIVYGNVEQRDKLGNWYPIDLKLGLLSIIVTTTKEDMNLEFLSRAERLEPIETKNQNVNIVDEKYYFEKFKWIWDELEEETKKEAMTIKFACKFVENDYSFDEIAIPFTESLKRLLDLNKIQVRRDKDTLIKIIKRVAVWNYKIRHYIIKNSRKYLLVHPNDLKTMIYYGKEIFLNLTKGLTPVKIRILNRIDAMNTDKNQFHRGGDILKDLKTHQEFSQTQKSLNRRLKSLEDAGYIEVKKDPENRKYNIYKNLSGKIKTNEDIDNIIEEAIEEYNQFIEDIKNNPEIEYHEVNIKDIEYPKEDSEERTVKRQQTTAKKKKERKQKIDQFAKEEPLIEESLGMIKDDTDRERIVKQMKAEAKKDSQITFETLENPEEPEYNMIDHICDIIEEDGPKDFEDLYDDIIKARGLETEYSKRQFLDFLYESKFKLIQTDSRIIINFEMDPQKFLEVKD